MRNSNRINLILAEVAKIWHLHPDLRLCELLDAAAGIRFNSLKEEYKFRFKNPDDLYYVEDDLLLKGLKKLKKIKLSIKEQI
jgi:hypothetical protein